MVSRRVLVVLAFVLSSVAPAGAAPLHDEDSLESGRFQEVMHRLIRASREKLRPLKTFRIDMRPGSVYWYEVDVVLPGAEKCRIYEHPEMVYRCEWKRPADVPSATVYASLVRALKETLSQTDWTVQASSGVTQFQPVNPRRNPLIEVRVGGPKSKPLLELLLFSVDRWDGSS